MEVVFKKPHPASEETEWGVRERPWGWCGEGWSGLGIEGGWGGGCW